MGRRSRSSSEWKLLITLSVVLLSIATVLDRVLGVVYAHYTGNKYVIAAAGVALALGLAALLLSLTTSKNATR